jgi:hypothetical protein
MDAEPTVALSDSLTLSFYYIHWTNFRTKMLGAILTLKSLIAYDGWSEDSMEAFLFFANANSIIMMLRSFWIMTLPSELYHFVRTNICHLLF